MGRVYAVASGKGGVGKTTTVVNLGGALAASGHETVVVDVDLGMGNLGDALGIDESAGATVHDVLAGTASVDDAIRDGPAGLRVVPGSSDLDDFGRAEPEYLGTLIDALDDDATVLLDTSAGLSHDSIEPLSVADEVLLVSTPERGAIRDTRKTREVADRMETPVAGAVLTRVRDDTDVAGVTDRLGADVRGTIPEDEAVGAATEAGEPLETFAPDAPATRGYRRLAADLTGDVSVAPVAETAGEGEESDDEEPAADDEESAADNADESAEREGDGDEVESESESDDGDGVTLTTPESDDADDDANDDDVTPSGTDAAAGEADGGDTDEGDADDADAEDEDDEDDEGSERTGFLRWLLG